jgi:hypothetical protein
MSLALIVYLLIFLTGLLTKFTDNLIDEKNTLNPNIKYITGLIYGFLVGFLLSLDPALATVIAAVIIGNLFFGRIDHKAHQLALAVIIIMIVFFGVSQINLTFLVLLTVFAWNDEFLNERSDRNPSRPLQWISQKRITLELAALGISIYALNPVYFLSILLFDLSYILVDKAMKRKGIILK